MATHVDSPQIRVRPKSFTEIHNYNILNTELYDSGLWYSWLDRELSMSGRVVYKNQNGKIVYKLVDFNKTVAFIPSEQDFNANHKSNLVTWNREKSFNAIIGLTQSRQDKQDNSTEAFISRFLGIDKSQILSSKLFLYDQTPPKMIGLNKEFLTSQRQDDLIMTYIALKSFMLASDHNIAEKGINMISMFDHEEVGSGSNHGAASDFLLTTLKRIVEKVNIFSSYKQIFESIMSKSIIISADMAHATHPNYPDKHSKEYPIYMKKGMAIKINENQKYSTDDKGLVIIKEISNIANSPIQIFIPRSDIPSGSTIGPIVSTSTGILTIDLGIPQLSMHSIREIVSIEDIISGIKLIGKFYESYLDLFDKFAF